MSSASRDDARSGTPVRRWSAGSSHSPSVSKLAQAIIAPVDDTSRGPVGIFGGRSEIGLELAELLAPGVCVVLAARDPGRLSEQVAVLEKAGAANVDVREFDADELASHAPLV